VGRYDFAYSNKKDLRDSLTALSKLPRVNKIHSGHGEETTIKEEKNNLPKFFDLLK
jgi:glyoxylase-like metal-dependent hydrolase (beta-lactamase superfamily II)